MRPKRMYTHLLKPSKKLIWGIEILERLVNPLIINIENNPVQRRLYKSRGFPPISVPFDLDEEIDVVSSATSTKKEIIMKEQKISLLALLAVVSTFQ